jgi:hypothetical protein
MVLVAVVHAGKYLLHKDGSIFLCELASGNDLIEEFSSLADPIILKEIESLTQSRCSISFHPQRIRTFSQYLGDPKNLINITLFNLKIRSTSFI